MAVHLHHLKKQYIGPDGSIVPVVDIDSLQLADGEQVALIGTSGSGKTTVLHLIAGILAPDSGRIIFGTNETIRALLGRVASVEVPAGEVVHYKAGSHDQAVDMATLTEAQRDVFRGQNIGYIFQTHHLLPGFTALENVLLGMSFTGRTPDKAWATRLLTEVGLAERMNYRPAKLSVGQQQRVAVARALANRPNLVLADEPTGALDEKNAQQVLDLIRKLCSEVGAALLLVSHDLNIARQLPKVLTLAEINRAATGYAKAMSA